MHREIDHLRTFDAQKTFSKESKLHFCMWKPGLFIDNIAVSQKYIDGSSKAHFPELLALKNITTKQILNFVEIKLIKK